MPPIALLPLERFDRVLWRLWGRARTKERPCIRWVLSVPWLLWLLSALWLLLVQWLLSVLWLLFDP